jgi:hypothetical protein
MGSLEVRWSRRVCLLRSRSKYWWWLMKKHGKFCTRSAQILQAPEGWWHEGKFHIEGPQILGVTVRNLVVRATWRPRAVRPSHCAFNLTYIRGTVCEVTPVSIFTNVVHLSQYLHDFTVRGRSFNPHCNCGTSRWLLWIQQPCLAITHISLMKATEMIVETSVFFHSLTTSRGWWPERIISLGLFSRGLPLDCQWGNRISWLRIFVRFSLRL